jgi:hypothetical protein
VNVLPDAPDLAFLDGAQQLGLRPRGQFADLVEKQRAGVRVLEHTPSFAHCACERAARVTEQLRFDQVFRQRRAVQRAERPVGARTEAVQHPCDEFLARSALALNQHTERSRRRALDGGSHICNRAAHA